MKRIYVQSDKIKELLLDLVFVKNKKNGEVSVIAKQAFELDVFFLKFLTDILAWISRFALSIAQEEGEREIRGKRNKGKGK